jgi:hypothetical protein
MILPHEFERESPPELRPPAGVKGGFRGIEIARKEFKKLDELRL